MEIFKEIRQWFSDYLKKRYIRGEIKKKFRIAGKQVNKRNNEHIEYLTNALFYGSTKIVKAELIKTEEVRLEYENQLLMEDIKSIIEKHYKKREEKLKKDAVVIDIAKRQINKYEEKEKNLKKAVKSL
jgi:hypothetical protein